MSIKVADLTADQLTALMEELLERKLSQWLGDPDEGLELRPDLRDRILRQRQEYAQGVRGRSLEDMKRRIDVT